MSKFYMCCVDGGNAPKMRHETFEIAIAEANRLAKLPTCRGRVYVLESIESVESFSQLEPIITAPLVTLKKKRLINKSV